MISLDRITDYILDSINTGVMVVDLTSHVVFLNREGAAILGEPREEVQGRAIVGDLRFYPFILLINDHRKKNPSLAASRRQVAAEFVRRDGGRVQLGFTISNLVDETRTVLGYVVVFRDLTEINQLRRVAQRSEKLAALGTMAAGVAHEIRNPLHAIRASVELMQVKAEAGKPIQDYVDIVFSEVQRLDHLVEDILSFARVPKLRRRPFDVNRVAEAAARLVEVPDGLELELDLEPDLPPVGIDPDRIKQVVLNLVQNAIQSQPEGGRVSLRTRRSAQNLLPGQGGIEAMDVIEVRVEDQGGGIPEEDLVHLFEPFFSKRIRGEGTGLGLPICQKLVEAHDGAIDVVSTPGKGSTFSVFLPCCAETQPAAGKAGPPRGEGE